jgi:hypothetical protein
MDSPNKTECDHFTLVGTARKYSGATRYLPVISQKRPSVRPDQGTRGGLGDRPHQLAGRLHQLV